MNRCASKALMGFMLISAVLMPSHSLAADSPASSAKPYIFDMWDQFVISAAAANVCDPPDTQSKTRHDANFSAVTAHVQRTLMSARYNKRIAEIDKLLAGRRTLLTKSASDKISQLGCKNADVQQITRRYKVQVSWQPPRS